VCELDGPRITGPITSLKMLTKATPDHTPAFGGSNRASASGWALSMPSVRVACDLQSLIGL
jgi:hypothetical protein